MKFRVFVDSIRCISCVCFFFSFVQQRRTDEFCQDYPHNLFPTPGYWIECSRQKISMPNQMWDESDSENEENARGGANGGGNCSDAHLERGCSDLYEDDEESDAPV